MNPSNAYVYSFQMKLQGEKTGRKGHLSVATEVRFFQKKNNFPSVDFNWLKSSVKHQLRKLVWRYFRT